MELYTAVGEAGYVAEKADSDKGWLFPVGDEAGALGYHDMFADVLDCLEEGREPMETFYDGYIVNAIIDAAYRSAESKQWESIELPEWRGASQVESLSVRREFDADHWLIKEERMPDGATKLILRHKQTAKCLSESSEATLTLEREDEAPCRHGFALASQKTRSYGEGRSPHTSRRTRVGEPFSQCRCTAALALLCRPISPGDDNSGVDRP